MAVSGSQLTRLGAYLLGAAKKLVIAPKEAATIFFVALSSRRVIIDLENRRVFVEQEVRDLEITLEARNLTVKSI